MTEFVKPPVGAPLGVATSSDIASALRGLRRRIEALGFGQPVTHEDSHTPSGVPFVTFANGEVKMEGAPPRPWPPDVSMSEMVEQMRDAVAAYRYGLPQVRLRLVWRLLPEYYPRDGDGGILIMRLGFDPVAEKAMGFDGPDTTLDNWAEARRQRQTASPSLATFRQSVDDLEQAINSEPQEYGSDEDMRAILADRAMRPDDRLQIVVDKWGETHAINIGPDAPLVPFKLNLTGAPEDNVVDGPTPEPHDVVPMLLRLLKDAQAGEITAIAIAALRPGAGHVQACTDPGDEGLRLIGAIEMLRDSVVSQHRKVGRMTRTFSTTDIVIDTVSLTIWAADCSTTTPACFTHPFRSRAARFIDADHVRVFTNMTDFTVWLQDIGAIVANCWMLGAELSDEERGPCPT